MKNSYQKIYLDWLIDILSYIVVLNLLPNILMHSISPVSRYQYW